MIIYFRSSRPLSVALRFVIDSRRRGGARQSPGRATAQGRRRMMRLFMKMWGLNITALQKQAGNCHYQGSFGALGALKSASRSWTRPDSI